MKEYLIPALGCLLVALVVAGGLLDAYRNEKRRAFVLEYLSCFRDANQRELVAYSRGLLKRRAARVLLAQLEQEGLVEFFEPGDRLRLRYYRLTADGRAEARRRADQLVKARVQ